jgi:hypothetical protein
MTKKQLQKAFDSYAKTGNLKPLTRKLIKLILHMAEQTRIGYELRFLDILPFIVESLKSLDLDEGKGKKK